MISIIVPVYNAQDYLNTCIESILGQTYKNFEIILIDDGSTDESPSICDKYAETDSRVKVFHKKNEGLVCARKMGLLMSTGEYVGYVDADDWIEADMYQKLFACIEEYQVDIAMCGRYENTGGAERNVYHAFAEGKYDKASMIREVYPRMIVGETFFDWNMFPGLWDKLFKREMLMKYQMAVCDSLRMGEDAACCYPAILNAESIYVLHDCLYHYRQTTVSMVKQSEGEYLERRQFKALYETVNRSFDKYKSIYDMREQWKKYVIFLMIPRLEELYQGYENNPCLFPFSEVKRGSRIILYGAGTYGQRLYDYLKKTGFCHVTAWVDRNFAEFQKMGLMVENPERIAETDYDYIVIANTYAKSRTELYGELAEKYSREKIQMIDEELLFSEETQMALGLK